MKKNTSKRKTAELTELRFLEALSARCPRDESILKALADLYTRLGMYAEGLKTDQELAQLCPGEALVWYNLACSYALLASKEEALNSLTRAVSLGYSDYRWLKEDSDLASLRTDRRFQAMVQKLIAMCSP